MAQFSDISDLIKAIDAKTNELAASDAQVASGITEVANDLEALRTQLAAGATPEQLDQAATDLAALQQKLTGHAATAQQNADALTAIGQDPSNPV